MNCQGDKNCKHEATFWIEGKTFCWSHYLLRKIELEQENEE